MELKKIAIFVTSLLGGCLSPWYRLKHKFDIINKLIYGQIIKYSTYDHPHMLLAIKPVTLIGPERIKLGESVQIGQYSTISTWSGNEEADGVKLLINDNVTIGSFAHITATNKIVIEEGVLIGKYVTITDNSHGETNGKEKNILPIERTLYCKGTVLICKNVWLGDKVTVLPGVCIGEGAIIGSNSVVTKDIPPYSVACGIPAKVIKEIQ